jgi:ABC-type multidrug transport system fused ATPase/permease subunit
MFSTAMTTYRPLWALLGRTQSSRLRLIVTLCLMLGVGILESATVGLLVPLLSTLTGSGTSMGFLERVLPFVVAMTPAGRVMFLCIGILGVILMKNAVAFLAVREAGTVRRLALVELRRLLLERVLHAPASVIETKTSGEISGAFLVEAGRANRALDYSLALSQRAIIAVGYVVAITVISVRLTLATLVLGFVLGFLTLLISRKSLTQGRDLVTSNAALGREVSETVGGLRVVHATAGQAQRHASFAVANEAHASADVALALTTQRSTAITETLGIAGAMGLTAAAHALWIATGTLEVSRFLAFGFGLLRLLPALNQTYGMHTAVTSFTGSVENMLKWLDLPAHPVRPFGTRTLPPLTVGVSIEGLSFEYPGGQRALRDIDFELRAGETVAVLGASGSGKSTLASVLLRQREPTAGTIRFDGVDHWEFAPESFHRSVAFVEQEPYMFNCSIAENVAFGAPWVTREEIDAAVKKVRLGEVIAGLPQGLDTVLGERGATLSGGQRQRLAIARAIVRNPTLLLLDEPTSALDSETEKEVIDAIDAASAGRTTVIITHRPSTVERAQRVIRLSHGALEGVGAPSAPAPLKVG